MSDSDRPPRPILITVIGVITLLFALYYLAAAVASYIGQPFAPVDLWSGLLMGLVLLITSAGFLRGWGIVWILGVLIYGLSTVFSVYTLINGGTVSLIPAVISALILIYLLTPKVRAHFFN
ncbi:MAG: hypothetical protein RBQ77_04930 [Candidatus Methanomethylophilaceae archaeon]|jgi:hypothetical protein|nr:hypothetical protein [Candidatus Methanomethylophilaceae archaeon]